ncbi:MAG: response regulator [Bacteroidia bacterium]
MFDKKIIMIIDDDSDDRFFFIEAVREIDASIECREAQQGVEALEQLRNSDSLPDFIFLDLNMHLMDGWQCLAELKKDECLKNIPVIIYTTSNFKEDMDLTIKQGAVYYLVKPSDISNLPGEIIKAMQKAEEATTLLKKEV